MRIAPEGWPFIALAWLIEVALMTLAPPVAWLIWLIVAVWVVAFFRDPVRNGPRGDDLIIAPADGKVVSIIPMDEPTVVGGAAVRISIFMNVFNVHVNRYATSGTVTFRRYVEGQFNNADLEKAALQNEHSDIGVTSPRGPLLMRQIAGSVARRIVTDHGEGTAVVQGERLGLIRFGSRVDVFVPAGTQVLVKEGDVTQAGMTVLAQWQ
ncbi:MAG TPA: phosphatidylserine decarboxylase family protein [Gemmatimonadales bacterium]|jgi:phosphatidylserine decarboxylase|nr:phosphatidylserine decarboxylase family protein [Gemmatimonadales bacterium]